ncbi:MAG: hypothetical protein U9Q74_04375 [Gemmatimonadota bacterium]|nr:hypothetical protein [Gemmatimonadota bacterium]
MGLFTRIKSELSSAGTAARGAIDEGRVRFEIFRVRQAADAAAQALGYAVHRARRDGRDLDPATLERLDAAVRDREVEATRLETELARHRGDPVADSRPDSRPDSPPAESAEPAEASTTADSDQPGQSR